MVLSIKFDMFWMLMVVVMVLLVSVCIGIVVLFDEFGLIVSGIFCFCIWSIEFGDDMVMYIVMGNVVVLFIVIGMFV